MRAFSALTLAVVMVVVAAGCTDAQPCSTCPAIQGTYSFSWQPKAALICATPTPRPATLMLTQVGSVLTSTYNGNQLTGTLFDTYNFVLNGSTGATDGTRFNVSGSAVTDQVLTAADAGTDGGLRTVTQVRLVGELRITGLSDGGCTPDDTFTADLVSP